MTGNILKQLEALVINFKNNPFQKARLKLSSYYAASVFVVLVAISAVVYVFFVQSTNSNLEYDSGDFDQGSRIETQTIQRAQSHLLNILFVVDSLALIFIAGLSYFLAGRTLKPIEQVYAKQKKFVADSAHEFRTPLAVMKTGAEALLAGKEDKAEYRKFVGESLEEINLLSRIVDDLLFLARSDDFRKVEFDKVDLTSLMNKQVEFMRPYALNKNITIKNDIQENIQITGNRYYLKRLLANLIKNAIDYNKQNGEVDVILKKERQQAILKITDTGIGIKKEDLGHVLDRFYKVEQAHARGAGGAGLGLSIVNEIIKSHNGKISIESELNKGTEITIIFTLNY